MKNYASADANIIFRAGEVSIRHFIGMPLILAGTDWDEPAERGKREKKIFL